MRTKISSKFETVIDLGKRFTRRDSAENISQLDQSLFSLVWKVGYEIINEICLYDFVSLEER